MSVAEKYLHVNNKIIAKQSRLVIRKLILG
jgi:hypothetical protein